MEENKSSYLRSVFNCPRMEFSPLHMVLKVCKRVIMEVSKEPVPTAISVHMILAQVNTEQVLL